MVVSKVSKTSLWCLKIARKCLVIWKVNIQYKNGEMVFMKLYFRFWQFSSIFVRKKSSKWGFFNDFQTPCLSHNFGSFFKLNYLIGFVEIRGQPELLIGDPPCCYHHHNIQGSNHVTASEAMEAAMTNSLRKRGRTDSHFCNGPTPRQQATMTPIGKA